jgi:alpha-tubulin suppressor-like RCC1 family protein
MFSRVYYIYALLLISALVVVYPVSCADDEFIIAAGACWFGNLGIGPCGTTEYALESAAYPTIVPGFIPSEIKQLSAGSSITGVIFKNGSYGGMGQNNYGGIGIGSTEQRVNYFTSPKVSGTALEGRTVDELFVGGAFMLARTDNGSLVGWGVNHNGVLANGEFYENVNTEARFSTTGQYFMPMNISCGSQNCFGVANKKLIAAWGDGDYCSLGINPPCNPNIVLLPVANPVTPWGEITEVDIVKVSSSSFFSVALDTDGIVWTVGLSIHIGRQTNSTIWLPINSTLIGDPDENANNKIIDIQAGGYHTLLLTADRRIFGFGYTGNGELGTSIYNDTNYQYAAVPADMDPFGDSLVEQIYVISAGSYARTNDGKVFAFGHDGKTAWGNIPTLNTNLTQYIIHHFYHTSGSPTHIFMIATHNPSPFSPTSDDHPSILTPIFGTGPLAPSSPSTPTGDASSKNQTYPLFTFLLGLVCLLAVYYY